VSPDGDPEFLSHFAAESGCGTLCGFDVTTRKIPNPWIPSALHGSSAKQYGVHPDEEAGDHSMSVVRIGRVHPPIVAPATEPRVPGHLLPGDSSSARCQTASLSLSSAPQPLAKAFWENTRGGA
jgi:hypothetical protein